MILPFMEDKRKTTLEHSGIPTIGWGAAGEMLLGSTQGGGTCGVHRGGAYHQAATALHLCHPKGQAGCGQHPMVL